METMEPNQLDPMPMDPEPIDPTTMDEFPQMFTWREAWSRALTHPREETFVELINDPTASFGRAATWIFVSSLIASLIFGIAWFVGFQLGFLSIFAQQAEFSEVFPMGMLTGGLGLFILCLIPVQAVGAVIGGVIWTAVTQFVASAFGGKGTFSDLFYAIAAFYSPYMLISGVLSIIPFVNICLSLPLAVYALCLGLLSLKAVNQFSWGRAVAVVLTLFLLFMLIGVILSALIMGPVLDAMSSYVG